MLGLAHFVSADALYPQSTIFPSCQDVFLFEPVLL